MRIAIAFLSVLILFGCSTTDKTEKVSNSNKSESYSTKEKELIEYIKKGDYDTVKEMTKSQSTQIDKDYFQLATAFEIDKNPPQNSKKPERALAVANNIILRIDKLSEIKPELKELVGDLKKRNQAASDQFIVHSAREKAVEDAKNKQLEQQNLMDKISDKTHNPGIVIIGMSKEEVLINGWGRPRDINKTTTKHGTNEQWVYSNNRYLYFENNVLYAIQD